MTTAREPAQSTATRYQIVITHRTFLHSARVALTGELAVHFSTFAPDRFALDQSATSCPSSLAIVPKESADGVRIGIEQRALGAG